MLYFPCAEHYIYKFIQHKESQMNILIRKIVEQKLNVNIEKLLDDGEASETENRKSTEK